MDVDVNVIAVYCVDTKSNIYGWCFSCGMGLKVAASTAMPFVMAKRPTKWLASFPVRRCVYTAYAHIFT